MGRVSISVHVDGYYGLVNGIPRMLKLFDRYGLKATFFVNMGREANIFEIFKYRRGSQISAADKKVVSRYSKKQKLAMLLLNRPLGHNYGKLLRYMESKGHEVEPHCWSHLLWSKNFNGVDILKQVKKMKKSYREIFGKNPRGFAPPTWKFNDKVINILRDEGFEYLAVDACMNRTSEVNGLKIIPLSFEKNIEELEDEGKNSSEILEIFRKELGKDDADIYFHADYEGIAGIGLFEEILKMIDKEKILTYGEIAEGI